MSEAIGEKARTAGEHDVVRINIVCGGESSVGWREGAKQGRRTVPDTRNDRHVLAESLAHTVDDVLVQAQDLGQRAWQARVDVCGRSQASAGLRTCARGREGLTVPRVVARPDDKVDLALEVLFDPVERGVDVRERRVAVAVRQEGQRGQSGPQAS